MLQELTIRNLALIESLQVQLEPGLNVFTGETGAGKSILIHAIGLVLGDRASSDAIKAGSEVAAVDAVFQTEKSPSIEEILSAEGVGRESDAGDDGFDLILTREIGSRGRSRVNGRPVPLQTLKSLGQALVDLHGQHEHQSLLRPAQHLEFLDRFGGQPVLELRQSVRLVFRELGDVERQVRDLTRGERERAQRADLLGLQMNEIDAAHLVSGEEDALREERTRLRHSEQLRDAASSVLTALAEETGASGYTVTLGATLTGIQTAADIDSTLKPVAANLETAYYHLEEVERALRDYLENLDADPARLEDVESRLHLIHQLKRKYGDDVETILAYRQEIEAELGSLTGSDEQVESLQMRRDTLRNDLGQLAGKLSQKRRDVSRKFHKTILSHLKDLAMEQSRFEAAISQVKDTEGIPVNDVCVRVGEHGADEIEFLISPNAGQPLKPLSRIASGGELSRIMLAIKCALTERHQIPTLVFDEIDVGIGGGTAKSVGDKLRQLSRYAQVLCVTHLPQIAALADAHFLVEKTSTSSDTSVTLRNLTMEERVDELARMLGEGKSGATARQHAQGLLAGARNSD
ncbi:MAG: DNA repair protein RecN [Armatimonadetes bacterium CG2_30_59_28]|nr:DNA repair protein RecN [Armatimonadota bacterium]OIO98667.1 MAG: DNA repair protein RecN [Armatimonadetes bacterium CG2_30_59_28]PIU61014.1 MAG: DNA repair protein RecN [Armatimonadetes bacterium CG07_land_8_20_14_0_80_59_28]PIY43537.1 MAG: DNA repair protein RecN [Armatimonadetes bacterium CG_4_10_14_3_um_filter_59_10]PJB62111.1 MAG: DNA repair protein RecN [Armatimonadetes bacterium CG_4_9_14_3_um_filter_58_7]